MADIAFLVDASGSVGIDNVDKMKEFVYSMVEKISVGRSDDRVGMVSYSSEPQLGFHLDSFFTKKDIINAVSAMQYRYGSTNTAAGLRMIRKEIFNANRGDRANVPNTCMFLLHNLILTSIYEYNKIKIFAFIIHNDVYVYTCDGAALQCIVRPEEIVST